MSVLPVGFGASGVDTGDITKSLRFRASGSTYMSRTPGSAGNRKTLTWSGWVKRGALGSVQILTSCYSAAADASNMDIGFYADDTLRVVAWTTTYRTTTQVFRGPSAHYHILVVVDTTQATANDRVKLFINGTQVTAFATTNNPALNADIGYNQAATTRIGSSSNAVGNLLDGYLSRICFVDGQALTPSSFGYQNTEINEWVTLSRSACKAVVDAGGTNSFMLDFEDGTSLTTLGNDYSTKNNDWTLTNHSLTAGVTYDWMEDRPGNSYAVLNPLDVVGVGSNTLSNANLQVVTNVATSGAVHGSIGMTSGKWYWEVSPTAGATQRIGIENPLNDPRSGYLGGNTSGFAYDIGGNKVNNASSVAYGNSYTTSDTISVAYDADSGKLWFAKNGTWQASGDPAAGTNAAYTTATATPYYPAYSDADNSTSSTATFNFGQRPFTYTPPTGFLALCQQNLTDETVTVSGSFTGNLNAGGPNVWLNGVPKTLTINGNAVTFGTHADKTAGGFKLRTASSSYNNTGSNTYTATIDSNRQNCFKYRNAQGNP